MGVILSQEINNGRKKRGDKVIGILQSTIVLIIFHHHMQESEDLQEPGIEGDEDYKLVPRSMKNIDPSKMTGGGIACFWRTDSEKALRIKPPNTNTYDVQHLFRFTAQNDFTSIHLSVQRLLKLNVNKSLCSFTSEKT
ncbi:hypothetical protein CKAN_00422300 [Cinnamomum micranthum f. kanehirae]|uniref:Uncharacterized protein n=1 Tax=Cinnamomum micranthum f. kanehirae TaxID=337451 RepID=A0A3S3PZI7_9MAGN|nr:hypothetical protein CKAN_00422300 [Cinnamomum micranthum f. kanehirae]